MDNRVKNLLKKHGLAGVNKVKKPRLTLPRRELYWQRSATRFALSALETRRWATTIALRRVRALKLATLRTLPKER